MSKCKVQAVLNTWIDFKNIYEMNNLIWCVLDRGLEPGED